MEHSIASKEKLQYNNESYIQIKRKEVKHEY